MNLEKVLSRMPLACQVASVECLGICIIISAKRILSPKNVNCMELINGDHPKPVDHSSHSSTLAVVVGKWMMLHE